MISPKQRKILAFPYSDYDAIICDGAVRSGKTSIMTVAFVDWAMREFDGQRLGICGKTVDSATKNIIVPYISMSYAKERYTLRWRRSDKLLEVKRGTATNWFEVFGGKDESSFMLIQGRTLAGVLLDEVALMPESFVNQALARCSVDGARLWFSCNPQSPSHWFHTDWIERHRERNALYLHFAMTDNPALSEKTLERYRSMYSGVFYDRYIRGLWVAADGLIYQQFADEKERYLIDKPPDNIMYAVIGLDFGGSKSAHAMTLTGFTDGFKQVIVLDEYYHNNLRSGRLSPKQLEEAFVDFVRRAKSKYKVYEAYCDSAEQTLIEGLTVAAIRARLGIEVRNAIKGPINDRIAFYNSLMAQDRFKIMRHCTAHIKALEEAVYDDSKPVKDVRLDNGTTDIDSLDSMEYSTETVQDDILYLGR